MKKIALASLCLAFVAPAGAYAQVSVHFSIPLPAAPPLVYVQPDVQVVEDYDEEVFFHSGFYWVRRDGRWFRSTHPRSEFLFVEPRYVPMHLSGIEVGRYRRYRHDMGMGERERLRREEFRREEMRRGEYRRMHEAEYRERERRRAEEMHRFENERRHDEEMRRAEHERRRYEERRRDERRDERRDDRRHEAERHELRREVRQEVRREEHHNDGPRQHQTTPAAPPSQQNNAPTPSGKHGGHDHH